jgi:hypothetical protein
MYRILQEHKCTGRDRVHVCKGCGHVRTLVYRILQVRTGFTGLDHAHLCKVTCNHVRTWMYNKW